MDRGSLGGDGMSAASTGRRRKWGPGALLISVAVAFAACGTSTGGTSSTSGGPVKFAQDGGTLTVRVGSWDCLDPVLCKAGSGVMSNAYATLVSLDAKGAIVPYLAKSWKQTPTQVIFT